MMNDLINTSNMQIHVITNDGRQLLLKGITGLHSEDNIHTYCGDVDSSILKATEGTTFNFKMNKKQWYRLQKSLGLIKPIYKRKKKGKRYILYEVI